MKTNRRLLQTVLLASLLFLSLGTAKAETFQVNGIYYSILSTEPEGIVKVIANPEGEPYSGENITIPSTVYYGGLPCKVTSIDPYAFKNSTYSRVTISSPVKSIGQYAFQDCKNLTYVKISEEVTAIQPYTFSGCSSLTDVVMPDGIEQIGDEAFLNCHNLAYIHHYSKNVQNGAHLLGWPTLLTKVGFYSFHSCKFSDIPTSLHYIGDYAFSDCLNLTSVRIPATVSYIGMNPFQGCSGIESIVVDSDNPAYDSRNNCNAIVYTNYDRIISGCKNTTMPSDIKSIWERSFYSLDMSSITIGQNVADIGRGAFGACYKLKRVRSLATTPPTCGTDAFGNIDLSSITLYVPNVTKYKSTAPWSEFGNILSLSEWKEYYTITYIVDGEVYATEEVAEGTLITPKEVPAKDGYICYEWKGLPETMPGNHLTVEAVYTQPITFESDGLWYSTISKGEVGVIANPNGEKYVGSITIPETVINLGKAYTVTRINQDAFKLCYELMDVNIPNTVTAIEEDAFRYSGITKIVIPNSINSIEDGVFLSCAKLTEVTIPYSVNSIKRWAFAGCISLTSISIPNSVEYIGERAFSASYLTSISVEEGNRVYDSREECNAIIETATNTLIAGCRNTVIPNSIVCIGNSAFCSCTDLVSISIPNSVTSIGNNTFQGCRNLIDITIPTAVESIGNSAFANCSKLTRVRVLGTVPPTCDSSVFSYSPIHEAYLYVPEESIGIYKQKAHWRSFGNILPLNEFKDYYTITYKVDGKVYTTEEMKAGTEISPKEAPLKEGCTFLEWKGLPKRMSGVDIEVEAVYLLEDNGVCYLVAGAEKEIKVIANSNGEKYSGDVIIPETITKGETTYTVTIIEKETFSNCSELANITIPSSIKSIGDDAFLACTNLAAVHITDLVAWCKIAFSNFYSNPLYVAHHLYLNSEEVKDLIIPESVKSIERYAFIGCTSITKAVLPNSLKELGVGVFRECSELKNINIPDSVKSISNNLFQKTNLHSITLHGGIEYIGMWAFGNCDSLKIAYCFSKEPPEYRMAFTTNRPVLYVPISSCENYKTANGWKSFATILPITYKVTYMVDGEEYATDSVYYDEPIIPIDIPAKEGCIFSGWSEIPDTMPAHDIVVIGSFEVNRIENITNDMVVDVYNLQGIKVKEQVLFKDLESILPKGMYIVNGNKVVVE